MPRPSLDRPPIVVAAYARERSLRRLLESLARAHVASGALLIVSVDRSDDERVVRAAEEFSWPHGEKTVVRHQERLGLKRHILWCGDLALEHGSVILFEDDLYASPHFYEFARRALSFYDEDEAIGGISLYAHRFNETAGVAFRPLFDDSDVVFHQLPSSWGQCWTAGQWGTFRRWLANHDEAPVTQPGIPWDVRDWTPASWKKHFAQYLVASDRYFVYPRESLSTNFGDSGAHHQSRRDLQVPLQLAGRDYLFKRLADSLCVYDAHLELEPTCLRRLAPRLADLDFTVDLYGQKDLEEVDAPLVLTSRSCAEARESYGRELRPHELNVVWRVPGSALHLAETRWVERRRSAPDAETLQHFHALPEGTLPDRPPKVRGPVRAWFRSLERRFRHWRRGRTARGR